MTSQEEWWALGWLKAFELTAEPSYLNRSRAIFDDLVARSWSNASCGGGVCWQASGDPSQMHSCYKNAITNELFLTHAAQLALAYKALCKGSSTKAAGEDPCAAYTYTQRWAETAGTWILSSGMINGSYLVNDGLDTFDNHYEVCLNNRHTAYTYNQGVILSGLAYLHQLRQQQPVEGSPAAAADGSLLRLAARIVKSVWNSSLVHKGTNVLREMNEPTATPIENLYSGGPGTGESSGAAATVCASGLNRLRLRMIRRHATARRLP
jgi:predicted alpha-1,6-mannanase (GH76 family)